MFISWYAVMVSREWRLLLLKRTQFQLEARQQQLRDASSVADHSEEELEKWWSTKWKKPWSLNHHVEAYLLTFNEPKYSQSSVSLRIFISLALRA